jgi:hypothetical protein
MRNLTKLEMAPLIFQPSSKPLNTRRKAHAVGTLGAAGLQSLQKTY